MIILKLIGVSVFGTLSIACIAQSNVPGGENNFLLGISFGLIATFLVISLVRHSIRNTCKNHRLDPVIKSETITAEEALSNSSSTYIDDLQGYKEDGVEKYQILATLDDNTCSICGKMDGKIFNVCEAVIGKNVPPFHSNCRCTTVPYYDDTDLAYQTRVARNPETGKTYEVPADMTYEEWRKESYTSEQKVILNASSNIPFSEKSKLKIQFRAGSIPPHKNWNTLTSKETSFFCCFAEKLLAAKLTPEKIILTRLSDGALNVDYSEVCCVGKIKLYKQSVSSCDSYAVIKNGNQRATRVFQSLQEAEKYITSKKGYYIEKRTTVFNDNFYMQYLIGASQVKLIQDPTLQECINILPYWINYIKYCAKTY